MEIFKKEKKKYLGKFHRGLFCRVVKHVKMNRKTLLVKIIF